MSEVRRYQERGIDGYALHCDVVSDDLPPNAQPFTYEHIFPQAQNHLTEHVQQTIEDGDDFDSRGSLRWPYVVGQQAIPLGIAAELAASQGTLPPTAIGLAAVSMGAATLFNRYRDRGQQQDDYDRRHNDGARVGQKYELYRPIGHANATDNDAKPVDLVWYGPTALAERQWPTKANIRKMAEMAKEAGINKIYADVMATRQTSIPYRHVGAADYVREAKGLRLKSYKRLIGKTPDEWLEMEDDIPETREAYDPKTKRLLLADRLRAVNPNNPLVYALEASDFLTPQQLNDPTTHNGIEKAAKGALARRLSRQSFYPEVLAERISTAAPGEPIPKDIQAVSEDGVMSVYVDKEAGKLADTVIWQTQYGPMRQDTLTALGLSSGEYTTYINMSAEDINECIKERSLEDPDKIALALELATFRLSYGASAPLVSGSSQVEQRYHGSGFGSETLMQDALKLAGDSADYRDRDSYRGEASLARHRWLQYGVGVVATTVLGLGLTAGHHELDALNDRAVQNAQQQLAAKRHVPPETIPHKDAQDFVNQHSGKARVYSAFNKVVDAASGHWPDVPVWLGKGDTSDSRRSSVSQTKFGVGNVDHSGKDTDQFRISAFNGAKAEGFWYTGTSNQLEVQSKNGKLSDVEWRVQTNVVSSEQEFPVVLPEQYKNSPRLRVFRELVDEEVGLGDSYGPLGDNIFMIPVLEGTKPVAGEINGEKAQLLRVDGNTYALTTTNNKPLEGNLDYWLVADDKAPKPTATMPISINQNGGDRSALGPKTADLKRKLDRLPTSELPHDNGTRAKQISQQWQYSFDPFTAKQKDSWKTLDDMLATAEKNKQANCNIANTDAILSDPTTNMVFGFMNGSGSSANKLSTFELHQKTIRQDATPSTPAPARSEAQSGDGIDIPYKTLAGIGAGILLATTQRRRAIRVAKKAVEAQYTRAQRKDAEYDMQVELGFAAHSDEDYLKATAIAEHAAYSGRPLTRAAMQQAQERVNDNTQGARSQAVLDRPHIASYEMADYVSQIADAAKDSALKQELRQSAQVLADGARVLALRGGAASTENVDRLDRRIARIKHLSRKALFFKSKQK